MLQTSICTCTPASKHRGCVHPGTWADGARIERLKRLWAEGHSAEIIAAMLGETTRNAVIGKVHRLGLPGRRTVSRSCSIRRPFGHAARRSAPPLPPRPPVARALPVPVQLELPGTAAISVRTLRPSHCRWPHGDPKRPGFHFCGRQKAAGSSYCLHHAAVAVRAG
jgi:GcrA cell cycle regulator